MSGAIDETDLHAFIDGELPPARKAEVAAAIARDPALAALVAAYRADKAALAAAFAPLETVPVPPELLTAALAGPRPHFPAAPWVRRLALAAAVAAAAAALALFLLPRAPGDQAVAQAIAAREQSSLPTRQLDGQDPDTLAAADAAMSDMLGNPVQIPDLHRAGFKLVSADIYGGARSDAVQLRYEDNAKRLFTVYLRPSDGPDAFKVTERGPVRICVWRNSDVTAVMTGEMSTPELFRLASLAYSSLGL